MMTIKSDPRNFGGLPRKWYNICRMRQNTKQKQQKKKTSLEFLEKVEVFDGEERKKDRGLDTPSGVLKIKGRFQPAQWIRKTNAQFPWLKIVLVVVLMGLMVVGVEEVLRHNIRHPEDVVEDAPQSEPQVPEESALKIVPENAGNNKAEEPEKTDTTETESEEKTANQQAQAAPAVPAKPVSTGRKLIALTFDDGPSGKTTPRLLSILAEKGVKATFFVVGTQAVQNPAILKQEVQAGHEVGSHTMNHANLAKLNTDEIYWQSNQMDALFQEHLGMKPKIMRPPYGSVNQTVRQAVAQPMILWTIDPEDWKYRNAASVRSRVVGAAFDGAIVLMHDIHSTTVDAVPAIIDDLRAQGYEFLTISELAAARGVTLQQGVTYGSFRP